MCSELFMAADLQRAFPLTFHKAEEKFSDLIRSLAYGVEIFRARVAKRFLRSGGCAPHDNGLILVRYNCRFPTMQICQLRKRKRPVFLCLLLFHCLHDSV